MLAAACPCGFTVEDETRDGIMEQIIQHAKEVHPDDLFTKMSPEEREKKMDAIIHEKGE